jgi:ATP-binding cassette subfamily C protein
VAIFATIVSVPIPLLIPLLIDELLLNHPSFIVTTINSIAAIEWQQPIIYISIVLFICFVLRLIAIFFNIIQSRQFAYIAKDIIFHIRKNLIQRLQYISMFEYESLGTGTVITHMVTDLDTLDEFIGSSISKLLIALLTVFGTAIILLWMHWPLGLFILCLNPLVIYFTRRIGSQVKTLKAKENSAYGLFQQSLTETLEAIHQIRASNREQHYCQQLIESARKVKSHATAFTWKSDAVTRLSFFTFLVGFDIFRATAMLMVLYSDLSIGQMLAVFAYLWHMIGPVQEILNIQQAFYGAQAALDRINQFNLLQQEPHYPTLENPFIAQKTVSVTLKNLHFSYHKRSILNGINLHINASEKVALVGASGGGKSTLVQTLIGLYPLSSGMIYFNKIALNQIGLKIIREHVVIVLQHPTLFNDSIRTNLTLGREASDEQLWQALEIAQLKPTVSQLEQGLDTLVGRQGMKLSGGQRQRLAIARMIIANPSVVILDEATSALDTETEYKLHQAMNDFLKGRTTIIIAHRLSAVKQADHVYVFEEGKICEQGRHETLIKKKGLYAKLYGEYQ